MKLHVLEQTVRALVLETRPQVATIMKEEEYDEWVAERALDGLERIQQARELNPKDQDVAEEVAIEAFKKETVDRIVELSDKRGV